MKKLVVIFGVFVSSFGFGQLISIEFYPEYGDNPLAQSVPLKTYRIVNMDFIDTLLYKVKDSSRLNDSFIVDIERRYNEVLDGVYSSEILNCYTWNNRIFYHVHITDGKLPRFPHFAAGDQDFALFNYANPTENGDHDFFAANWRILSANCGSKDPSLSITLNKPILH